MRREVYLPLEIEKAKPIRIQEIFKNVDAAIIISFKMANHHCLHSISPLFYFMAPKPWNSLFDIFFARNIFARNISLENWTVESALYDSVISKKNPLAEKNKAI